MRQILFFILIINFCENSFSQNQRFIQPNTNLYNIRQQFDAYYDSIYATSDSLSLNEGGDYAEYKKYLDFWHPRLFPHGDFTRYFDAQKTYYSSNPLLANSDPWWEIGPSQNPTPVLFNPCYSSNITAGVYGIGPIEFITFYKNDANKMLVASTVGGLFYSTDGGNNWQHTGTDTWLTTSGVQSVVFDPNTFQTWYAASSGQGRAQGMFIGFTGGIFRTANEGQSWTQIADRIDLGSEWTIINKIIIDPSPQTPSDVVIYAATSDGVKKTNNADAANPTWVNLTIPLPPSVTSDPTYGSYNFTSTQIYDLEFKPQNSQTLYATVQFMGNDGVAPPNTKTVGFWVLMQSNNGGNTWFEITNQPTSSFYQPRTNYFENAEHETIEVTNAPGGADFLYFALDRGDIPSQGQLWRLTVSTNNWNQIANNIYIYMGAGNGFGVNQFDPNEIYIANSIDFTIVR